MLIYVIKKGKKYKKKLGWHKPNPVKPHKCVSRPQMADTKIKNNTQVYQPLVNPKTN